MREMSGSTAQMVCLVLVCGLVGQQVLALAQEPAAAAEQGIVGEAVHDELPRLRDVVEFLPHLSVTPGKRSRSSWCAASIVRANAGDGCMGVMVPSSAIIPHSTSMRKICVRTFL